MLAIIAVALLVFWVAAKVVGFALGAVFNLLWVLALVLLVVWAFQRFSR